MEDETIGIFNDKKYKSVHFIASDDKDIACNHCAFELGRCRGAIWILGQCYVVEGGEIVKNIYFEEIKE